MATTFITLVNDTLRRLNEVELTATDFSTASGFRAQVKDAVNQGAKVAVGGDVHSLGGNFFQPTV